MLPHVLRHVCNLPGQHSHCGQAHREEAYTSHGVRGVPLHNSRNLLWCGQEHEVLTDTWSLPLASQAPGEAQLEAEGLPAQSQFPFACCPAKRAT